MSIRKKKTDIKVSAVYDGQLDATDLFVSLIARQYTEKHHKSDENITKEYLVKKQDMGYDNIEVQKSRKPPGLCG